MHQESTIPAIFEIINRLPSSEFQKKRKGFVGWVSNRFFVSRILIAPPCAIAATEASGDGRAYFGNMQPRRRKENYWDSASATRMAPGIQAPISRAAADLICRNVSAP